MNKNKFFAGKNILVTGGTGFIGSHLTQALIKEKANIIIPFKTHNPKAYFFRKNLHKKVTLIQADIKNKNQILNIIYKYEVDFIFHLAAQAIVETAYWNPYETLQTNINGTINILEGTRLYPKIKGVIIVSSDKAYGKIDKVLIETDPLRGNHPYEVSKSCTDLIAQAYFKTYKLPLAISRFGNVFGPGDLNFNRIIPGIMKAIIQKETLLIRSNGQYRRDYIFVEDIINASLILIKKLEKNKGEAFNFSSTNNYSVLELIEKVSKILKNKIKYNILNEAKNEIPCQTLNCQKAKKLLCWKANYSFTKAIKETYLWYKKYFQKR